MKKSRIQKEAETVRTMINMYCKDNHSTEGSLCDECAELASYAESRALNCQFGNEKPVCGKCKVHCYKQSMREKNKNSNEIFRTKNDIQTPNNTGTTCNGFYNLLEN